MTKHTHPPDGGSVIIITGQKAPGDLVSENLSCAELGTIINSIPANSANAALIAKLTAVQSAAGC